MIIRPEPRQINGKGASLTDGEFKTLYLKHLHATGLILWISKAKTFPAQEAGLLKAKEEFEKIEETVRQATEWDERIDGVEKVLWGF